MLEINFLTYLLQKVYAVYQTNFNFSGTPEKYTILYFKDRANVRSYLTCEQSIIAGALVVFMHMIVAF